jgi:N-methylhydantoinase A/oxoprolinase/acetone carboxylase beta subunit
VRQIVFDGESVQATVLRGELAPGTLIAGAALCALPEATLLIPPGWSGEVDEYGTIRLTAASASSTSGDGRALSTDASLV